eukprot:6212894-Pleurochrysis_carterae.AAC.3
MTSQERLCGAGVTMQPHHHVRTAAAHRSAAAAAPPPPPPPPSGHGVRGATMAAAALAAREQPAADGAAHGGDAVNAHSAGCGARRVHTRWRLMCVLDRRVPKTASLKGGTASRRRLACI